MPQITSLLASAANLQLTVKLFGRVNEIWAAFVHIWRVFNIVKTALPLSLLNK